MNADQMISEILDAHTDALRLQQEQRDAAGRRQDLVQQAMKNGVSVRSIADALGVDRQRIYQMAK